MSTAELDASAFTAAAAALRDAPELVDATAGDVVDDFAQAALVNVRRRRARHRVTGKGERLVTLRATGSGAGRQARVHAGGRVAPILAGGSRAHLIRPLSAHALSFAGAGRRFAAYARHPGTRPDPFVERGIDDTRPQLRSITDTAGDELAAELAHTIGRR